MVGKMRGSVNSACTKGKRKQHTVSDCLYFNSVCKWWRGIITTLFNMCSRGILLLVKLFQSGNKTDHYRDWGSLPDYLIELIVERLPLVDCLSFSCVCEEWKRITNIYFVGSSRGIPLLVKPFQSENITKTCLNVLNKNKNSSLYIPMPEYIGSYIWGSYCDWLFLMKPLDEYYSEITLVNPFSGEKVVLPKACGQCPMMVVSSDPSLTGCIYMLVPQLGGVSFWTSGNRQWRQALSIYHYIVDALYHEGNFYLFGSTDKMIIINEKSVVNILKTEGAYFNLGINQHTIELPGIGMCQLDVTNLVESRGDILLARRIFNNDIIGPIDSRMCKTCGFEMYRLDVSQMAWVKLESLGEDQVLFLGNLCSRSFHANELGDALVNRIYFSNSGVTSWSYEWDPICKQINHDYDADDWGVINLQKNSIWYPTYRARTKICAGIWVTAPIEWCLKQTQMYC